MQLFVKRNINNERLTQYLAAERAILGGQAYTIGNRSLTRANLAEVRKAIEELLAAGAVPIDDEYEAINKVRRSRRVVFRD